jgi:hypothetical protein
MKHTRGAAGRSAIWGPHYWFFLHTLARTYPELPNEVIKRKYYDFIMNLPLFIPDDEMSAHFSHMLEKFPVTPYLCGRESFVRWMYFMHNKINRHLDKDEISFEEACEEYENKYREPLSAAANAAAAAAAWQLQKHHFFLIAAAAGLFVVYLNMRR